MESIMTIAAMVLLVIATVASALSEQQECLTAHNKVRAEVGVPALVWSNELADYARRYAEKQRDHAQCAMVHSRGQYGENLFWGMGKRFSFSEAVKSWADEARDYDEQENKCAPGKVCGHYTQVVWSDTKAVGCASVACHDGATFIICSYDPPGNFVGERPFPVPRAHKHRHSHTREAAAATDRGDGGDELSRADAKLCQCMLNCVQSSRALAH